MTEKSGGGEGQWMWTGGLYFRHASEEPSIIMAKEY